MRTKKIYSKFKNLLTKIPEELHENRRIENFSIIYQM